MKPFKPLYLKTYGKQKRKLSAWLSPEDRKKAFDSTPSSSDDTSVFMPSMPRGTRNKPPKVGKQREMRFAKRKAMLHLTEKSFNKENLSEEEKIISSPPYMTRRNKGKTARSRTRHPNVRTARLCLTESSSTGDDVIGPPSSSIQRRTTRTSRLISAPIAPRIRNHLLSDSTESEEDLTVPKQRKTSTKTRRKSYVPSAGHFVTHRRCAPPTRRPEGRHNTLASSDESSSGAFCSSRVLRPSRQRRRLPATFWLSSADSSVNATETSGLTANPLQEISLNGCAEHSSRKPIFCSTPSAPTFNKEEHLRLQNKVTSSLTVTLSRIGILSTFEEDLKSLPRSCSESPSEETHQPELDKDQSFDLFMDPRVKRCSEESEVKNCDGLNLFSANSENSSHFVSAARSFEWLSEALQQKCLNQPCKVFLKRLDSVLVAQLCSPTSSYCLELSSSFPYQGAEEPSQAVENCKNTVFSSFSSDQSVDRHVYVANGSEVSAGISYYKESDEFSNRVQNLEPILIDNTHHTDHSYDNTMDTETPGSTPVKTSFTDKEPKATKHISSLKACRVNLLKLSESQEFMEAGEISTEASEQDLREEKRKSMMVPVTESHNTPEAKAAFTGSEEALIVTSALVDSCVSNKLIVKVKKLSLPQLKDGLQQKLGTFQSCTEKSDLTSDACTLQQSEIENSHCFRRGQKRDGSARSGTTSGKYVEQPHPKRKRTSPAPKEKKRKSTTKDLPRTTRKACVSGMSVSRWKNKGGENPLAFSRRGAVDCSMTELISTHKLQEKPKPTMDFSTPLKASQLHLSSLLADLTPNTHTWSRLKAALSVHRKGIVQLTPRSLLRSRPGSSVRLDLADISQDLFASPVRTPLSRHLQSQLPSQLSQVVCVDAELSDAEKVYAECSQPHPLPWEECIQPHRMKRCVKIGEGTFGEVFSTTNAAGDTVALKIIPVEGSEKVNGEDQKTFGEILHEIIISKELSSLKEKQQNQTHGFIGLHDLYCVKGPYPPDFLKAWDTFNKRKGSENDRPDFFEEEQLFLILEFEFGGTDLENRNGQLASLEVARSILHQVTAALAVAEQELHFEHRDLHWGNVLVKTTRQKTGTFLLNGTSHSVETKGVLVRIIDYSLSRLEIDDLTVSCDISNDEELFMGQGDYQFEIYRLMRQENGNNWTDYHPHSNVLWLHYLCSKLLAMKYRGSRGRGARAVREELTAFCDSILHYGSATEALHNCPMFH